MNDKPSKPEDRPIAAVERLAGAADRYGIPGVTFAVGAVALLLPAIFEKVSAQGKVAEILPWLGTGLMIAALLTYIWQTWRSTTRVHTTPPAIPSEFSELMNRMLEKIDQKDAWQKEIFGKLIDDLRPKKSE